MVLFAVPSESTAREALGQFPLGVELKTEVRTDGVH